MSIFKDVAKKLKESKAQLEAEAMGLGSDIDKLTSEGMGVIRQHQSMVDGMRGEFNEMKAGIEELKGNGEEVEDKVSTFPPKTGTNG